MLLVVLSTTATQAQLIAPGELTEVHANLEGIRNCTNCHQLGQRGIDPDKCLSCHTPLRDRIRRDEGFHATVSRQCASCHKDHFGRDFDPVRLATGSFDHSQTGFDLVGRHLNLTCRGCHRSANVVDADVRRFKGQVGRLNETFLGLSETCASCHDDDDPHGASFQGQSCASCHTATSWTDVEGFDHGQTGFALVGQHLQATCASCHPGSGAARFENVATTCQGCHGNESPHSARLSRQDCATCHTPANWSSTPSFNHRATGFALVGQHARIACTSCHGNGRGAARFRAATASCETCHGDENPHGMQFEGQSCASCHGAQTWTAVPNFNHGTTAFVLTGAHVRVDCTSCHTGDGASQVFADAPSECAACHDDAHEGVFGTDCATCHTTADWPQMARTFAEDRFDHETHTGYALVGAHGALDCAACHTQPARRDADIHITLVDDERGQTFPAVDAATCQSCHTDYHDGTFAEALGGADCGGCHTQTAFAPTTFDLARHAETAFPLTGAHLATPCTACHLQPGHTTPTFDIDQACEACHAEGNPHGEEFADPDGVTRCAGCHNATDWDLAAFDHSETGFSLLGAHLRTECTACHTPETQPDGSVVRRFTGLSSECASCHLEEDPHAGQFEGQTCDSCHDTQAFTITAFNHAATRFPLAGAHETVACAACHRPELTADGTEFVRFKPLGTACADCHGSE
ncbi:MAG: hypothetical protein HKN04_07715 [Rhodothermaceae bacterium]|nr:hypothetical protein [Rhodothermaceae bacterium]